MLTHSFADPSHNQDCKQDANLECHETNYWQHKYRSIRRPTSADSFSNIGSAQRLYAKALQFHYKSLRITQEMFGLEATLAGYQNNLEAARALFNNLQQAMAHITPTKVPGHLASKPKAVKLLKERGRLQQSIKPLKQMQKNSKLGDAEVELHADKATLQLTTFTLQVYSSVLAAYTAAIRAKTQALEVEADNKPKADVAIARCHCSWPRAISSLGRPQKVVG
jgi:tetratricopeptide (TPR) repeat protein